jgi:Lon protease (S16) C-terminal proteolytic domain
MSAVLRLPSSAGGKQMQRHLLKQPWCRPSDPDGVVVREWSIPTPEAPPPGVTIGVTVGGAALYQLAPGLDEIALAPDAAAQERRAARLASREVGVDDPRWIEHPSRVGAKLIDCLGYRFTPIEGPSMGLPMFLAHVSRLIGEPIPVDLASTGALDADGAVLPVDGVPEKVEFLENVAVAVRRVLVPRGVSVPERAQVAVIPVGHVREALQHVFPNLEDRLRARWEAHPAEAALAARRLYRVAAVGALHGWEGVMKRAGWLREVLPPGALAWRHADMAYDIAHRHTQVDGRWSEWPDALVRSEEMRPFRLRLVAHLVQGAADHSDAAAIDFVARARRYVLPLGERSPEDAILLGAIGRALASVGQLDAAAAALDEAITTWEGLEDESQASYALCERLRIAGVQQDAIAVRRLGAVAAAVRAHPATEALTDGFVCLALARAQLRLGLAEDARSLLDEDLGWEELPPHLRSARGRFVAGALALLGRDDEAQRVRTAIPAEPWRTLAHLDEEVARGGDGQQLLAVLASDPTAGREVRRLLERCPPGASAAEHVALHFRY